MQSNPFVILVKPDFDLACFRLCVGLEGSLEFYTRHVYDLTGYISQMQTIIDALEAKALDDSLMAAFVRYVQF